MLKALIGIAAAATISLGAFTFAAPARAAEFYVGPIYERSCRTFWSERMQVWVRTCDRYYREGPGFGFEFSDRERHRDYDRY
jgi:hypothetical protein